MAVVLTAAPLAACAGSSGGSDPESSATPTASASTTHSVKPLPKASVVGGAPSRLTATLSAREADRVVPRLRKLPGVFRVHYNSSTGKLFVYLLAGINQ